MVLLKNPTFTLMWGEHEAPPGHYLAKPNRPDTTPCASWNKVSACAERARRNAHRRRPLAHAATARRTGRRARAPTSAGGRRRPRHASEPHRHAAVPPARRQALGVLLSRPHALLLVGALFGFVGVARRRGAAQGVELAHRLRPRRRRPQVVCWR
eukprot:6442619-Prymnesium_polylepis.1